MAKQINMHGARAKLGVLDKRTGKVSYVGVFNSVNVSQNYDALPAFILGRFSAASITYVGADVVSISCSGYRVVKNGRFKAAKVPALGDLMVFESLTMTVEDRQPDENGENPRVLTFKEVYPVTSSESHDAKQLSSISINYIAMTADDEDTTNEESPGAMTII